MSKLYSRKVVTPVSGFSVSPEEIPATVGDAYAAVLEQTLGQGFSAAGWKLGGTTLTTRRAFAVQKPYFGVLHQTEILTAPLVAPGLPLVELKGEAEVALRLSQDCGRIITQGEGAVRSAAAEQLFDAWCWSLEMPSSPILNLMELGIRALLADRCAAGALILGAPSVFDPQGWGGRKLTLLQDGEAISEGSVEALIETPQDSARQFLLEAQGEGYSPAAGQWIATGGLTPCVPMKERARIALLADGDPVLTFVVGRGGS